MHLEKLTLLNFKNYPEASFSFIPKLNCIVGKNAVGKTNILDAIHYLSLTKSYFNPIDSQNIRYENDFFIIQGQFQIGTETEHIHCGMQRNKKKQVLRNKKELERFSDHIGLIPVVMVSPADAGLILDGSEERRKFINNVISQFNKSYLDNNIQYNRLLIQRNKLLKTISTKGHVDLTYFEVLDHQMSGLAQKIYQSRLDLISQFTPVFYKFYSAIAPKNENVALIYKSDLQEGNQENLLKESFEKDKILGYTSKGIHKDDLVFELDNHPIKKTGSQGQQKTFLVALKLAKLEFIRLATNKTPILLLDDIFDKFDTERVYQIIQLVADENAGQIFLTDTSTERLTEILEKTPIEHKFFEISPIEEIQ